ncbi:hypothetical protein P175DRAFT_0533057 [Aspergillus ochraceoroseus IBT 24754]|uniref:Zn(2)-C6 fungal-type domain-containing protein n=3 Tax=Aspergillus subgen. Nidulantes TaxID=2720870 RepID=A0A0F8USH3_9EURO|nr:uncharacterized protein P175DRAFT_0533057 [Aspergillus ochraceoroseus IBT 24754]KKK15523.1 hypothetical protein AOCH_006415 [Aspergillus ochraceoroseus]KKK22423.1 hypothetical protein ARAM_001420 [Aspergillus rambellii]PTU20083.1 hypothetical protein P175DRAFT_0533057 [Aspergillus ochraceoroseus IBT 24754]
MSGSNYPSPFPYSSYTPSDFPETGPVYGWLASTYTHPSFTAQGPSEVTPTLAEPSTNAPTAAIPDRSLNSKVAIPRSAHPAVVPSRGRVGRACDLCRDQKVKCTGERPTCQRCQESGIQCSYGDRKREKMARRLSDLTARIQTLEALLQTIYPSLDSQSTRYVEQILSEQPENHPSSSRPSSEFSSLLIPTEWSSPLGSVDFTNEDFNRDRIQAMGFVGEHSEVAWIYKLKQLINQSAPPADGTDPNHGSFTTVNFFLDDSDVAVVEDIDLFQRPLITVADRLVDVYFQAVHPSFPIISKVVFLGQYKSFYSTPSSRPGKRWLAILNLIFSIAAKYAGLVSPARDVAEDDHHIYFSRAWKLSMRDVALDHPNLQQVQVEGLSALYLMIIGHSNRSWRLSGVSIQSAVTMGLNLRNESNIVSYNSREIRYRVWWSLYILHISLCVMTGRLPSSSEDSCTTPPPVPFIEEEFPRSEVEHLIGDHGARVIFTESLSSQISKQSVENAMIPTFPRHQSRRPDRHSDRVASVAIKSLTPNTSLHFLHLVELGLIMRRSIDALYAPGAAQKSWHSIEKVISSLNGKADSWLCKLPAEFHFTQGTTEFKRERLNLAFSFYSLKILINQPCLSRLIREPPSNDEAETFCTTTAGVCADFGGRMLELLPDIPDLTWASHMLPWWCIVHYIMQATTVLMLTMVMGEKAGTVQYRNVLHKVSKAADWLAKLGTRDLSAHRAWVICRDLVSELQTGLKLG